MRSLRLRRWRRRLILVLASVIFLTLYLGHSLVDSNELVHFVPDSAPEDAGKPNEGLPANGPTKAPDGQPEKSDEVAASDDGSSDDDDEEEGKGHVSGIRVMQDPRLKPMVHMSYDTTARPPIKGLATVVAELPVELAVDGGQTTTSPAAAQPLRRRRLVFVGDVHGQRSSLDALLEKIGFNTARDHLVLTGDLVDKGPDSAGVVQLAMEVGASAVRGNFDDRVLVAYETLQATRSISRTRGLLNLVAKSEDLSHDDAARLRKHLSIEVEGRRERALARLRREEEERRLQEEDEEAEAEEARNHPGLFSFLGLGRSSKAGHKNEEPQSEEDTLDLDRINADLLAESLIRDASPYGDDSERAAAASLSPEQYRWLSSLPTILHIGRIATASGSLSSSSSSTSSSFSQFDDVVVVHAGLVPSLPLARQDPLAVMTMRSLVHPADEVRRERARTVIEYDMRVRSRGYIRPGDVVDVPEKKVDAVFHKLQHAVYGPDLQHPRVNLPSMAAAVGAGGVSFSSSSSSSSLPSVPALLETSPSDLVLLPVESHFSESKDGSQMHWAAIWNQVQHSRPASQARTTVIYGHDARTGLAVPPQTPRQPQESLPSQPKPQPKPQPQIRSATPTSTISSPGLLARLFGGSGDKGSGLVELDTGYTFGLDSGCVYGHQLTALVVEAGPDGNVQHYIEQVDCPKSATFAI